MNTILNQLIAADSVCKETSPYYIEAANIRAEAEHRFKRKKKTHLILLCVLEFFFLSPIGVNINGIGDFLFMLVFAACAVAIFLFYKRILVPKTMKEYEQRIAEADNLEAQGNEILQANIDVLSVIPSEYWYPMATDYMVRMIETGRAQTINQALAMYDEFYHRWKMEESNRIMQEQQEAILKSSREAARNSGISAAASVFNAVYSISKSI